MYNSVNFSHFSSKIYSTGEYYRDEYIIEIDNKLVINFTTNKEDGVTLQLYVGDNVDFTGKIYGVSSYNNKNYYVQIMPEDGAYLAPGASAGIRLAE